MKPRAYLSRIINPRDWNRVEDMIRGALVVDPKGRILDYGPRDKVLQRYDPEIVNMEDMIIVPGLVDLHAHIAQLDIVASEAKDLWTWLERYVYPAEARFREPKVALDVSRRFYQRAASSGTTTACLYGGLDLGSTDIAFQEAERSGLRVLLGMVTMDRDVPPGVLQKTDESSAESKKLCGKWHGRDGGRILYSFIPKSATCCSFELMQRLSKLARKYDAYIQTHLSESLQEISWVRRVHPDFKRDAEVYHRAGILSPKTIVAHAIYLTESELMLMEETQTSIAHCPSSNLFLKSGVMDLHERLRYGIRIGLGSDIAGGANISIFSEMGMAGYASSALHALRRGYRHRLSKIAGKIRSLNNTGGSLYRDLAWELELHRPMTTADSVFTFYLATLGGARALGLEGRIGSFTRGKDADFVVVDYSKVDPQSSAGWDQKASRILAQLAYRTNEKMIVKTYVRGRKVYPSS